MKTIQRTALHADINVTPLVDVCLVLLIIFMFVTPLMVTGMPVHLPQAGTAEPLARQPLQLTLTANGMLFIGQNVVRADEAAAALQRARAEADRPIVVQADKSLSYAAVADLLDGCRAAGFSSVGLATLKRD